MGICYRTAMICPLLFIDIAASMICGDEDRCLVFVLRILLHEFPNLLYPGIYLVRCIEIISIVSGMGPFISLSISDIQYFWPLRFQIFPGCVLRKYIQAF